MIFNLTPPESTAVEFIEQTLTDTQKAQARTNIGALDSSSLVSILTTLGYTKVATGSYVGDGQGSIQLGTNSAGDILAKSTNARKIQLPFAPNVILLINKSTGQSIIITSGAPLNTYAKVLRSYDGYTNRLCSEFSVNARFHDKTVHILRSSEPEAVTESPTMAARSVLDRLA